MQFESDIKLGLEVLINTSLTTVAQRFALSLQDEEVLGSITGKTNLGNDLK